MTGPDSLVLFGPDLAKRVRAARWWLRGRYDCAEDKPRVREGFALISDAVAAASAGDLAAAEERVAAAEGLIVPWRAEIKAANVAAHLAAMAAAQAAKTARQRQVAVQERRPGDVQITDTVAAIKGGLRGRVPLPGPPDPYLVAACDGSWAGGRVAGWAYLTSAGQWGARADAIGTDPSGALLAELLAAGMVLDDLRARDGGVLLADSAAAVGYLAKWRAGSTDLPVIRGDDARAVKRRKIVEGVRWKMLRCPQLEPMHVHGHRGHHLNEAADMMAKMAMRWRSGRDPTDPAEMRRRCEEVAAAFLRSWYGTPAAARARRE